MKQHFLEVMHRRREALQPSLDLRKHYLEATTAQQQRVEREAIMSRVFRLQPGPRKAFMLHGRAPGGPECPTDLAARTGTA